MLVLQDRPATLCDGVTRRQVLRAGGLSLLGLGLPELLRARDTAPLGVLPTDRSFGRAKSVIFLYLAGGPPQHETFDPKPDAPAEIRGAFRPVQTNVPGIQFCELLPRTAALADKLAVVRSMSTNDNRHSSSSAWVLTGYPYKGPNPRTITPTDWPYFGSIVKMLKPSESLPPLSTVWLPDRMRLNENVTPAGQTGGFLGPQWDPDCFVGDPSQPGYRVRGMRLSNIPPVRLDRRRKLLKQVEEGFATAERGAAIQLYDRYQQQAFELMTSGRARAAFAIDREPEKVRSRYGRNRWGQCVLLARRLVEAGVRLVHVQWPREDGDNAVDNPLWDTHAQNADRLEDVLCPQFDVGFSALVEDLDSRGLLDETLVVAIGEFGRTPKINSKGGRDHWGPVFSCALAGAGIRGGQVFGASDKQGAYPARDRVEPGHLTATIFHLLGIPHQATFTDREAREHRVTAREPISNLLGDRPATGERVPCTADPRRVPPFDPRRILVDPTFTEGAPLRDFRQGSRPKTWRANRVLGEADNGLGAKVVSNGRLSAKRTGRHLALGFGLGSGIGREPLLIAGDESVTLAQEVRSPFAGRYVLQADLQADASSPEFFAETLARHFEVKLEFIQFTSRDKSPAQRKSLASLKLTPALRDPGKPTLQTFELEKEFVSPKPGSNFSFGLGLGVALSLTKKGKQPLTIAAAEQPRFALLRVARIELEFFGKPRNNDVVV